MKVKIKDYQILKEIELDLTKGITAIVGSTNNGKSSIIRAIRGAINNQGGNSFVNYDADETQVTIDYLNNRVDWVKSKKQGKSYYNINGEVYNKIGQTQLPEVADIFNMPEVSVGNERFQINFWKQLDKPFLVDKTPYQLFEFISQSKDQEQVEQIRQESEKQAQGHKKEISTINTIIDTHKAELNKIEKSVELYDSLNKFNSQSMETALDIIEKTLSGIKSIEGLEIEKNSKNSKLKIINKLYDKAKDLYSEVAKIKKSKEDIENLFDKLNKSKSNLKELKNKDIQKDIEFFTNKYREIETYINMANKAKHLVDDYKYLENKINQSEARKIALQGELSNKEADLMGILTELDKFNVCPLCNSIITGGKHEHTS